MKRPDEAIERIRYGAIIYNETGKKIIDYIEHLEAENEKFRQKIHMTRDILTEFKEAGKERISLSEYHEKIGDILAVLKGGER